MSSFPCNTDPSSSNSFPNLNSESLLTSYMSSFPCHQMEAERNALWGEKQAVEQEKSGLREELVRVEQEKMEIDNEKHGRLSWQPEMREVVTMVDAVRSKLMNPLSL